MCINKKRGLLELNGYGVSDLLGWPSNRKLVAYFQTSIDDYCFDLGIRTEDQREAHFDGFLDELSAEFQELEQSGRKAVIISSEHFHSRIREPEEIVRIKEFLDSQFSSVEILCYLREQSAVRRSSYSTALRTGYDKPIEEFHSGIWPGDHFYDYGLFLNKWATVFGRDAISVALFDPSQMPGNDIRRDFLQRIGVPKYRDVNLRDHRANESLSLAQAMACREINRVFPRYKDAGGIDQTAVMLLRKVFHNPALKVGRLHDTMAEEIFERFDEVNIEFGQTYLGLAGNPFTRPRNDADASAMDATELETLVKRELMTAVEELRRDGKDAGELDRLVTEITEGSLS